MPVERREQAIAIVSESTGNGRNPILNGRRKPSRGGTSRMTRECQVRICEGLGVKFPGPTRQKAKYSERAHVFRCYSSNGHEATTPVCRLSANRRQRERL